jgi:hypothetical protein
MTIKIELNIFYFQDEQNSDDDDMGYGCGA